MIRRLATLATAAAISIATLTGCVPPDTTTGSAQPTSTRAPFVFAAPTSTLPAPKTVDPYTSTGTWKVPSQIEPGTYQVTPIKTGRTGYYALCATLICNPGDGMIDNEIVTGPEYVVIGADAIAIELRNVALTPEATA